jgi:TonB family protein
VHFTKAGASILDAARQETERRAPWLRCGAGSAIPPYRAMPSPRTRLRPLVALVAALCPGLARAQGAAAPSPPPDATGGAAPKSAPDVTLPVVKKNDGAAYPRQALDDGFRAPAEVALTLTLDAMGLVTKAVVEKPVGHGFDEAAVSAAQKLEFQPALRDGKAVAARIRFVYRFVPPPGVLSGRVVSLAAERPLAGAVVVVRDASGAQRSVTTGADGGWRIEVVAPASYHVIVSAVGMAPHEADETVQAGEVVSATDRLEPPRAGPSVTPGVPPSGDIEEVEVRGAKPPREVTKFTLDQREIAGQHPSFSERERRRLGIDPARHIVLARAGRIDQDEGPVAASPGQVRSGQKGHRVDPTRRQDGDGRADRGAPLQRLEGHARRRRVHTHRRRTSKPHRSQRVTSHVEVPLVAEALQGLVGRLRAQDGLVRSGQQASLRPASAARRGEAIRHVLDGARFLERDRLLARDARQDQHSFGLALAGHHRRQERPAIVHPLRQRSEFGAAHLEGIEDLRAQGGFRLSGGDQRQRLRHVRLALTPIAGRVDGADARGCEGPQLGRRRRRSSRRTQRQEGAADGVVRIAARRFDACLGARVQPRPSPRSQRRLEPGRCRADAHQDSPEDQGCAPRPSVHRRRPQQGDASPDHGEHHHSPRHARDLHRVPGESGGTQRHAHHRDQAARQHVGVRLPDEARHQRCSAGRAQQAAHAERPFEDADLQTPPARRPLGGHEQDGDAGRSGCQRPRARVEGQPCRRIALGEEARGDGLEPDHDKDRRAEPWRHPLGAHHAASAGDARDGQARGDGADKSAGRPARREPSTFPFRPERRHHDGHPPTQGARKGPRPPGREEREDQAEQGEDPPAGLASAIHPDRHGPHVGHGRQRKETPPPGDDRACTRRREGDRWRPSS